MKSTRIMLFMLFVAIAVCCLPVGLYAAEGQAVPAAPTVNDEAGFRTSLSSAMKDISDVIKINIGKYDKNTYDINRTVNRILNDDPELFYVRNCTSTWTPGKDGVSGTMTVSIYYLYPKDSIKQMANELTTKVDGIIGRLIQADMNNNTKELMVHDYVVSNTSYADRDMTLDKSITTEGSTAYSALVKGKGDSIGHARAMKLLLDRIGIECMVVNGSPDTWNIVKIEGDYYHLNASADELVSESGKSVPTRDFFNVTDAEMSRFNEWDKASYPQCTSTKCNYFYKNNTIVGSVPEFEAAVKKALEEVQENISIRVTNFDPEVYDVSDVIRSVMRQNPILDDVYEWDWAQQESMGTVNVMFNYFYTKDQILSKRQETIKKADEIIKTVITPGMNDFSKLFVIHNYIIEHTSMNDNNTGNGSTAPDELSAYGVLVKGKGASYSYADALKILLDKAGIECIIVRGDLVYDFDLGTNDEDYPWNIVKIGGKYYHVDAAGDDVISEDKEIVTYFFFNVDDNEMSNTHIWDRKKYPACTSIEQNYFYKNKLFVTSPSSAVSIIKDTLKIKNTRLLLKIKDYNETKYDIEKLITDAFNKSGLRKLAGASWTIYKSMGIVDIKFEY